MLVSHAAVALLIDTGGREVVDANLAAARFFGYSRAQMQSMPVADILALPAQDLSLAFGQALRGERSSFLVPHRLAGGTIRTLELTASPVSDGRRNLLLCIARDIAASSAVQSELEQARSRYELLDQHVSDVVVTGTIEGGIDWVSASVARLLGWEPRELIGQRFRDLIHPADRERAVSWQAAFIAGQRVDPQELRMRQSDGGYRWIDVIVTPVADDAGRVIGMVGGWRDAQAEHAARSALAERDRRYRLLVEHTSDVVVHWVGGELEWVSPAVTPLAGWHPAELAGRAAEQLWHPDDRELGQSLFAAAGAGGESRAELRLSCKDGGHVWVEVGLSPTAEPDGRVGAVAVMRDIASRRAAQQALADAERSYRRIAQNATDVILQTGSGHAMTWASPSAKAVLGWEPSNLVGRSFVGLVHPDDREAGTATMLAALAAGRSSAVVEARFATADGGWRWMSDRGQVLYDEAGRVVGGIDALRDIQAEVEAREALQRSEARYRMLAGNATDVVYLVGPDGLVEWVAPTVTASLGWQPEDLLGRPSIELTHPDDIERLGAAREQVFAGADVIAPSEGCPVRIRDRHGSYRWMSVRATVLRGDGAGLAGVVVGMKDVDALITARDQAELDRAKLQATLDSLLDPHVNLRAVRDSGGHIVDFVFTIANDAACAYNRISRDRLVGATILGLFPAHASTGLLDMYREVVETGVPLVLDDYPYPHEIVGGERYFDIRAVRVGDTLSFTWRDVTDRRRAALQLAESEERYRLIADTVYDVVLRLNNEGVVTWVSPSLTRELGWRPEQWEGRDVFELVLADDIPAMLADREAVLAAGSSVNRLRVLDATGAPRWVETHTKLSSAQAEEASEAVISFRTIDVEVATEAELLRRARFDDLTGVLKRDEAVSQLKEMLVGKARRPGDQVAVMFADVDDFKAINDSHGHTGGDVWLATTARRIAGLVRAGDLVARMGGDEFLVILPGVHDLREAKRIAEKLRKAVAKPIELDGIAISTTLSIGVTLAGRGEGVDDMVQRADRAMYKAKRGGRDQVVTLAQPR